MLIPYLVLENLQAIVPPDWKLLPAYGDSVGVDLYNAGPEIIIPPVDDPHSETDRKFKVLIPTGLKVALPANTGAFIFERGSIVKTPLKVRAGVIDPSYTGQIFVNCVNLSNTPQIIPAGAKLPFQLVFLPVLTSALTRVSEEDYAVNTFASTRGEGKIGSSDR